MVMRRTCSKVKRTSSTYPSLPFRSSPTRPPTCPGVRPRRDQCDQECNQPTRRPTAGTRA
eukprot:5207506-Pyramimonas_sp.AAC.1